METEIVVRFDERLDEVGEALRVSGTLAKGEFVVGDRPFSVPDGIAYDLVLTHTGEAILATGTTQALLLGECDRCLGEAKLQLQGEVDALYALPGREFDPEFQEDVETYPIQEDLIDLTAPVVASIAVEIPFKVLCSEDCKGLCPVCGQNLNEGQCDCAERKAQESDASNPFSVLRTLRWDEDDSPEASKAGGETNPR